MYIDLEPQSRLQPYVLFDWRLIAERGLRCFGHFHRPDVESKTVASCEICFLLKVSSEQRNYDTAGEEDDQRPSSAAASSAQRAGQFKCVGAIRKAGFLYVKKWILKRKQSIELARKQGWKRYWICLRGTALLFYSVVDRKSEDDSAASTSNQQIDLLSWVQANCNLGAQTQAIECFMQQQQASTHQDCLKNMSQCFIEREPRHLIIIEGAIAQPIPEHPKRDFVFCLSTTFGDAYLFQSSCQYEQDNWISAMHNACAASIARDLSRDEATKLFETKIRHLELEAEKKLFLRHRLESRLTSMSSMGHIGSIISGQSSDKENQPISTASGNDTLKSKKATMRSLLLRLNQQLLALDHYIEQVNCEVYQLRCYLVSCSVLQQSQFYQSGDTSQKFISASIDLPHPKTLLMHVSKPTKLLLIKLGVFTVSSFHAYIHARQGSAEAMLQRIQQQAANEQLQQLSPIQLRVRSQSISEMLSSSIKPSSTCSRQGQHDVNTANLEATTERLIDESNLQMVRVRLNKVLFSELRQLTKFTLEEANKYITTLTDSDDRYSLQNDLEDEFVVISMKLHINSSSAQVIKQVLKIVDPNSGNLDFLKFYLRYQAADDSENLERAPSRASRNQAVTGGPTLHYVVKQRETLADWSNMAAASSLELAKKVVFKLELTRSRVDEQISAPFGVSLGAQLFTSNSGGYGNVLNVYCSYIEWGSAADKAGLKDDDELLLINGVPVMDLDMMFVECMIREETKLRMVIRSSRADCPEQAQLFDGSKLDPSGSDSDSNSAGDDGNGDNNNNKTGANAHWDPLTGGDIHALSSQIISDEYISTLVCPPPPTAHQQNISTLLLNHRQIMQNQQLIDADLDKHAWMGSSTSGGCCASTTKTSEQLASDLLEKTQQLTKMLTRNTSGSLVVEEDESAKVTDQQPQPTGADSSGYMERLKRSIMELFETEYAFVKHLETIIEYYMIPLDEVAYLNIHELVTLSGIIHNLVGSQRKFFSKLTRTILSRPSSESTVGAKISKRLFSADEIEQEGHLDKILQQLDNIEKRKDFEQVLVSLARTFVDRADKFKLYAAYCATYSSLQKILHPKKTTNSTAPFPSLLDTFIGAGAPSSTSGGTAGTSASLSASIPIAPIKNLSHQHRDFLKPLMLLAGGNSAQPPNEADNHMTSAGYSASPNGQENCDPSAQLRQLNKFLASLDSSSSSASISLPTKSLQSSNDQQQQNSDQQQPNTAKNSSSQISNATTTTAPTTTTSSCHNGVLQQNFESYLIKPIQRIVKYPMLLNSITLAAGQVNLINETHVLAELQNAVKQMESVASFVNDAQRVYDDYGALFEHIERLYVSLRPESSHSQLPSPPLPQHSAQHSRVSPQSTKFLMAYMDRLGPAMTSMDQLLHFGPVEWLNVKDFAPKLKRNTCLSQVLFVFSTCVVFICREHQTSGKKKLPDNSMNCPTTHGMAGHKYYRNTGNDCPGIIRYQTLIPVNEVQVRSVQQTTVSQQQKQPAGQFHWELFRCSSINSNSTLLSKQSSKQSVSDGKVYLLSCSSNESRGAFLRRIRLTIRDSVRNMNLPLARSPSSKSLTPKKMSSPSLACANSNSCCSHSTSVSLPSNCDENCQEILGENNNATNANVECCYPKKVVETSFVNTSIRVNN